MQSTRKKSYEKIKNENPEKYQIYSEKRKTQQSTAFYKAKIKNDITIPNRPNIGLRGSMPIRPTIQVRSGVGNDTNVIQVNNNEDPQNNTYIFRQRNNLSEKSDEL